MIDFILDILFPKYCVGCRKNGSYICPICFSKISFVTSYFCTVCGKDSFNGLTHPKCVTAYGIDGVISVIEYKGIVKKLLYQFKYEPYLSDLKGILGKLLYEGVIQNEAFNQTLEGKEVWITSVPLSHKRELKRGYNQSNLLGKELSSHLKLPYGSRLLFRKKETKPQFELKREDRFRNMKGAFALNEEYKEKIKGKVVFIVDDITTTGSTLAECGKVLKRKGANKVLGIVLAHEV